MSQVSKNFYTGNDIEKAINKLGIDVAVEKFLKTVDKCAIARRRNAEYELDAHKMLLPGGKYEGLAFGEVMQSDPGYANYYLDSNFDRFEEDEAVDLLAEILDSKRKKIAIRRRKAQSKLNKRGSAKKSRH